MESFWDQIGPRGAKMGPRGPSRASKYRKPEFANTLKNHWFFKVFGGPRPSQTASADPRRLPRGYLGLLGTILSHLGAILETRAFKKAPASWDCSWTSQVEQFSGPLWRSFWSHFGTRSAQEEPRWAQEEHQELQSTENLNVQTP